jgi:hypothetical protein
MESEVKTYTQREIKKITQKISKLTSLEHSGIFNILTENNIQYTYNNNGVFINMAKVPHKVIEEIEKLVKYCFETKESEIELSYVPRSTTTTDQKDEQTKSKICAQTNNDNVDQPVNSYKNEMNDQTHDEIHDWTNLLKTDDENKNKDKVELVLTNLSDSIENISKKKANTKYRMATRKFSRKQAIDKKSDKRNEVEMPSNLVIDTYVC